MDSHSLNPLWFFPPGLAVTLLIVFLPPWLRNRRRRRILATPFPADWETILQNNMPLFPRLPVLLQDKLRGLIKVFIAEKHFIGCNNLIIDDEMRVTIASQACLIQLGRKHQYFPKVSEIHVYPGAYVQNDGEGHINYGESWADGRIVLAWDAALGGPRNIRDGHNLVVHEFAHQLDQIDGNADGTPTLQRKGAYETWARVCSKEYKRLRQRARKRRKTVMDKYGATDPAEFFAVGTETFFEKPDQLKKKHKEWYEELKAFYGLDPAAWI